MLSYIKTRVVPLLSNKITIVGGGLVGLTAALLIFLAIVESFSRGANPYTGMFTYLVLPPVLLVGLLLVPIGVVRRGFFPGEQDAAVPNFTSSQEEIRRKTEIRVGMSPLKQLTPTQQPLERVRHKVTLITGMDRFYQHHWPGI